MRKEVLKFIKQFQNPSTIKVFTEGCCYWFAVILNRRFKQQHPTIMYHPINNHFAVRIDGTLYDITGEIDSKDFWEWRKFANLDYLVTETIYRDCIYKYDV